MASNLKDFYLKHEFFRQVGHLTSYEIETMGEKYPQARKTERGIPVFGMMDALNQERKKLTEAFGSNLNEDVEGAKLEYELKYENILSKRILNQTKLGMLILKDEASSRVKSVLRAAVNSIKVAIKHSASRLFHAELNSQRDVEQILTKEYNDAIKELENSSKIISWEQDGSSALLQTRLESLEAQDPEFVEAVKEAQRERS